MTKPLCIELYAGCFGWSAGWLEAGGRAVGFDLEHEPHHGDVPENAALVLQDVRTIHGAQFKDASLILASPPCQEFSYRAMPWKRAKALGPPVLGIELFWHCWRIQHEACEAAGRYIPMIVENVMGAQRWVGPAKWHYGSFYLWGDVPALMPIKFAKSFKGAGNWFAPRIRKDGTIEPISRGKLKATQKVEDGTKCGGDWFGPGVKSLMRNHSSKSPARKAASAQIAKIPMDLSRHIARTFKP